METKAVNVMAPIIGCLYNVSERPDVVNIMGWKKDGAEK